MTLAAVRVGAQVPQAPDGLLVVDDVEALAVRAFGGLDGPVTGKRVHVHAVRPDRALTRVLLFCIAINVAIGAARPAEVVLDGDDGAARLLGDHVHRPGPPSGGGLGASQQGSYGVSVRLGYGRHAGHARLVVEADVLRGRGAARPDARAQLDAVFPARVDERCKFWRGKYVSL